MNRKIFFILAYSPSEEQFFFGQLYIYICRSPKETPSEKMSAAGEPGYSGAGDPPAR